jgi:hypothetical protein
LNVAVAVATSIATVNITHTSGNSSVAATASVISKATRLGR